MNYGVMLQNPKTDYPLAFYIHDDENQVVQAWEHPLKNLYVMFYVRKVVPLREEQLGEIAQLLVLHAGFVEVDVMRIDTFGFVSTEWLDAPVREPNQKRLI